MFRLLLLLFSLLSLSSCADLLSSSPVDLLSDSLESADGTGVTGPDGSFIGSVSRLESLNYCPRVQTRAGTSSYRIFTDTTIDVVAVDTTDTTNTDTTDIATVGDTAIATTTAASASDVVADTDIATTTTASDVDTDIATTVVGDNLVEDLGEDIVADVDDNLGEGIVADFDEYTVGYVGEDAVEYDISDLHYQGTITRVARQCIYRGDELDITIGIRARAILGPIGSSGDITMPFRVVLRQPECLYLDRVFDSVANFSPDVSITTFRLVTDPLTIPVPDQTNVLLYVGFDNPAIETPELPICES